MVENTCLVADDTLVGAGYAKRLYQEWRREQVFEIVDVSNDFFFNLSFQN